MDLRITNSGLSPAKNINITSDPDLSPVGASKNGSAKWISKIYRKNTRKIGLLSHPIIYLPPREGIKVFIGLFSGLEEKYPDLNFCFSIRYDGVGGPFTEEIRISLKPIKDSLHQAEYEVGDELHKIREVLEHMGRKMKQ